MTVDGGRRAVLRESSEDLEAALYQDFVLPDSAYFVSFVLSGLAFDANLPNGAMPDAFGVSLVDPCSGVPLVATRDTRTDSYYIRDLVPDANVRDAAAGVLVTPGPVPGSWRITVDVSAQAGQAARLLFRLLSGSDGSQTAATVAVSQVVVGTLPALNVLEDSGTTPLGLAGYTPVGTTATTAITVTQVPFPVLGGLVLADGSTAVTTAESYSLLQLQGTQFRTAPDEHGADLLLFQLSTTGGGDPLTNFVPIVVTPVNDAPAFTGGPDVIIPEDAGPQSSAGWATGIRSGPANEAGQTLQFSLTTSDDTFFAVLPSIDANSGTLTFTPTPAAQGVVTVSVTLHDDGGTADGGVDHSAPQTFTITVDNAPMLLEAGEDQAGDEGQLFRLLSTAFTDFGRREGYVAEVDWGDGTPTEPASITMQPDTPGDPPPPLAGTITAQHAYADDGVYTVKVRLRNGRMPAGAWLADQFAVTVANVAPSVTIHGVPAENVFAGGDIVLTSTVVDPGTADTFTYLWAISHDGTPYLESNADFVTFIPSAAGQYLVTLAVRDDDGGQAGDVRSFIVAASDPLRVDEVIVNDGAAQRSNLETIRVRFNQQTNLQALIDSGQIASAIHFVDAQGQPVFEDPLRFQYDPVTFELAVDLTTDGFGGSRSTLLSDGRYALHLDPARITAAADPSVHLEDDDGLGDAIRQVAVHRLLADFDGDADVDLADRDRYFQHHGSVEGDARYDFAFDLNADRAVDNIDYYLLEASLRKEAPLTLETRDRNNNMTFPHCSVVASGLLALMLAVPARSVRADVIWLEGSGDAGSLPTTAQSTVGSGTLDRILGRLDKSFADIDMFGILVPDPALFSATTVGTSTALFDTELLVFDGSGKGVAANDDAAVGELLSSIPLNSLTAPGIYYLAIALPFDVPVNPSGGIFPDAPWGDAVVGPTGLGGGSPIAGWDTTLHFPDPFEKDGYEIRLTGAEFQLQATPVPEPSGLAILSSLAVLAIAHSCLRRSSRRTQTSELAVVITQPREALRDHHFTSRNMCGR